MNARWLLLGAVFGAFSLAAVAGDWPQWRGPGRDNKVVGFTAPAAWPKDLTQKWKVSVGEGVASPVLAGEKVYTFTRQGGDEVLLCLNASDGKEVWKDKYEAEEVKGPPAGFKGGESFKGPRSSPAVANGKVCSLGVGGVVSCLDAASGKVAWRKDTKAKPQFYAACSPLMVDGLCIVYVGSGGRGELTAFELATGEAKWKWSGDGPSYGSPVLMTAEGVKQVVVLSEKNLVGVGLADGKLLWQIALSVGKYPTATPVIDGATVICAGTAVTVVKEGDKFTTKPAWKGQAPHQYNTPVLKDGLLYGLTGMGKTTNIYCQDAKTGEVLWTDKAQQGECGSVLDAGSVLLALSSTSELIAFKPSKDGFEQLAKYKVADTPTWAEPIIDGNRVFVKDRESLALWTIE